MSKFLILLLLFVVSSYIFGSTNLEGESRGKVYIFSAVKGNVSFNGIPIEGLEITRTYPDLGKVDYITETITTDINGDYSFDEVTGKLGIMRFLPHEAVIDQTIKTEYLGDEFTLWYTCKRNYKPLGEFKYIDNEPILNLEMGAAYNDGYILINSDLKNREDTVQKLSDDIWFFSISDFDFPYESELKKYSRVIVDREDEFINEINKQFLVKTDFFDQLTNGEYDINEIELEGFKPYFGVKVESIDKVIFSDQIRISYFYEDYSKDIRRVNLNGEIILNVISPEGEKYKARVWLNEAQFSIGSDSVELLYRDYNFMINSYNIDPNDIG